MGASVPQLVALLSKDFVKPVLIAVLIASPIAWWGMNKWKALHIGLIQTGGYLLLLLYRTVDIVLTTVSLQAIKAAMANPVKSLKSE